MLCDNLEERGAEGGVGLQEGRDTYASGRLMLMYGKTHHDTVK